MEQLPLLPFGKVDRMALPAPEWDKRSFEASYEAPQRRWKRCWPASGRRCSASSASVLTTRFLISGGTHCWRHRYLRASASATGVELAATALWDTPTVATLALKVADGAAGAADGDDLTALLDELEQLSDDEAHARLDGAQR